MAQIAISAVGAAAGFYVGGPTGAAVGWSVGAAIGGSLFGPEPPERVGPRLDDLAVQSSAYGEPIPKVWGAMRVAGNLIWSSGIQETKHKTKVGGKGGPSQKVTTFTYSASFAVSLCEGPILGVRRLWADGKLIYDAGDDADPEAILASHQQADGIAVYLGDETQLADPIIEAVEGAGEVPAFRGQAYLVWDDLQLADYGNRIPNITAEVVGTGTVSYAGPVASEEQPPFADNFYLHADDGLIHWWGRVPGQSFGASGIQFDMLERIHTLDGVEVGTKRHTYSWSGGTGTWGWTINLLGPVRRAGHIVNGFFQNNTEGSRYFWVHNGAAIEYDIRKLNGDLLATGIYTSVFYDDAIYALAGQRQNESATLYKFPAPRGVPAYQASAEYTAAAGLQDVFVDAAGVWVLYGEGSATTLVQLTHALAFVESWLLDNTVSWPGLVVQGARFALVAGGTNSNWYLYELLTGGTVNLIDSGLATGASEALHPVNVGDAMLRVRQQYITFGLLAGQTETLGSVAGDLCTRVGLVAGDLDLAALTDALDGYARSRPMTARAALSPLQRAYHWDLIESDWQLKAVPRGGAAVRTLSEDALAAHEAGQARPEPLTQPRRQDLELPRKVAVQYMAAARDYQAGKQYSSRLITDAVGETNVALPLVLSDDHARQIADVLLWDAWMGRNTLNLALGPEHLDLEPGDVIQIQTATATHTVRITDTDLAIGLPLAVTAAAEEAALYSSSSVGESVPAAAQTLGLAGPTELHLLDIPILQDADDDAGIYVAVGAFLAAWRGAQLFRSIDSGASWAALASLLTAATVGVATDALADGPTTIWDRGGGVNIDLRPGDTLAGVTEASVLGGDNHAVIGAPGRWEIVGFRDATLESDGTYTLSNLLRGRLGTEQHTAGHQAGDVFILLESGTLGRVDIDINALGLERLYKAVTLGDTLQGTDEAAFTALAEGLKPYSPVHMAGARNASGDLTITWVRRTRIGGEWQDYVDVPLGEASEAYEVDVLDGASVVRTLTATTPSVIYTAANQVTDFGTAQASVDIEVYQISATVGRGHEGAASV